MIKTLWNSLKKRHVDQDLNINTWSFSRLVFEKMPKTYPEEKYHQKIIGAGKTRCSSAEKLDYLSPGKKADSK